MIENTIDEQTLENIQEYDVTDVTVDVTQTTEEVIENAETPVDYVNRNMFYANDALQPPPPHASAVDKKRYQQIKKSVKRLRKLEKNPIFIIKMLDMKGENK
jgi:hypothetical protein